jgi:hypothetical protein
MRLKIATPAISRVGSLNQFAGKSASEATRSANLEASQDIE